MARGFGTTLGSGTTDKIVTDYTGLSTASTWALWAWRNGAGGGNIGRYFDKDNAVNGNRVLHLNSSTNNIGFIVKWSTTDGSWVWSDIIGTGAWYHLILSYDGANTSNLPVVTIAGAAQTILTTVSSPAGTLTTGTGVYYVGNRADDIRNWDGKLAEFGHWNRILSDGEKGALAAGYAPSFFPQGLGYYYSLNGRYSPELNLGMGGGSGTVTGTAYQDHPRIIYPGRGQRFYRAASVAGLKYPQLERGIRGLERGIYTGGR